MSDVATAQARAALLASGAPAWTVHALLCLSGFAGLGYQVVWTRMLSTGLGHEAVAVLAVVAAFFAGLALGAALFDRAIARSRRPGLWYAALEAVIGLWTLALIRLIPLANEGVAAAMGQDPSDLWRWTVAFGATALLLAPATVVMGATTPAAERLFARMTRDGRGIGGLYAANVAGATAGALLTAAWLAPAFGFTATLVVFAALNLLCAAATLLGPARGEASRPPLPAAVAGPGPTREGLATLAATGFLGIGFEVAVIRALAQVSHNTVYTFVAALCVYLIGAAAGSAWWQRARARREIGDAAGAFLAVGAACGWGAALALAAPLVHPALVAVFGGGLAAEVALAALVFGPASVAMGALFARLAQACRGSDGGLGAAFAANTLGAALAPVAVGVLLVPEVGVIATLALLALGYPALAIAGGATPLGLQPGRALLWAAGPALAAFAVFGPLDRRLVSPPPGGAVLDHREGVSGSATVVRDAAGHRHLVVNGTFVMGGTNSFALDRIQGHAPLLLHPAPRRALFLGVGAGATLAAAAAHPDLRAEGVDLSPEVVALIPAFEAVNGSLFEHPDRIALHVADARRWVRAAAHDYDVIVADNFHPAKDGAAFLYTREHFAAVRDRLAPDGVFAQWLPLHQLDLDTLRVIAATFLDVFPDARLQVGNFNLGTPILALVGARDGRRPDIAALIDRDGSDALFEELGAVGIDSPFAALGGFLAGPRALAAFVADAPINTDDRPRVLFEAPRTVYQPLGPAQDRLVALLDAFERRGADAVAAGPADGAFIARLEAYWAARDAFIRLGATVGLTGDPARDADALAPALLDMVRLSPDFTAAYRPLLALAESLATVDPERSLALLASLDAAAPARREARLLATSIRERL